LLPGITFENFLKMTRHLFHIYIYIYIYIISQTSILDSINYTNYKVNFRYIIHNYNILICCLRFVLQLSMLKTAVLLDIFYGNPEAFNTRKL